MFLPPRFYRSFCLKALKEFLKHATNNRDYNHARKRKRPLFSSQSKVSTVNESVSSVTLPLPIFVVFLPKALYACARANISLTI